MMLRASSWEPWAAPFRAAGYETQAPNWPGDGETVADSRRDPDAIGDHGIDDVVAHFAAIIDRLPSAPILIGHSFGGMIDQKLLGQDRALAAIAIDAAQIKGVLPVPLSALRATLPVFENPANKRVRHRTSMKIEAVTSVHQAQKMNNAPHVCASTARASSRRYCGSRRWLRSGCARALRPSVDVGA